MWTQFCYETVDLVLNSTWKEALLFHYVIINLWKLMELMFGTSPQFQEKNRKSELVWTQIFHNWGFGLKAVDTIHW